VRRLKGVVAGRQYVRVALACSIGGFSDNIYSAEIKENCDNS
jgi:hypothetical protein